MRTSPNHAPRSAAVRPIVGGRARGRHPRGPRRRPRRPEVVSNRRRLARRPTPSVRRCRCGRTVRRRGPRGTSARSFHPIVVGSSAGRSATQGSGERTFRGRRPGPPTRCLHPARLRLRSPRPAPPSSEQPSSRSTTSHRQWWPDRTRSASGGPARCAPLQRAWTARRPAATRPSVTIGTGCWSTIRSAGPARRAAPWTAGRGPGWTRRSFPAQVLPSPTASCSRSPGTAFDSSRRSPRHEHRARRPSWPRPRAARPHHQSRRRPLRASGPALPLTRHQRIRASRLDDGHHIKRNDEHRPAHAQRAHEGAIVVQRPFQLRDGVTPLLEPRGSRQVDGRRIGPCKPTRSDASLVTSLMRAFGAR